MITLKNLSFTYRKGRTSVFEGLDLTFRAGSVYGLLGKNGTGKSTMLHLLTGLLIPSKGEASIDGYTSFDRRPEMLEQLFLLPEDFSLPRLTPSEFAATYGKFYPKFSTSQFAEYLSKLEVDPEKPLHSMSFGQRKKGYIAFALACNTKVLLMDEPTNGLDIPSKSVFRRLVASIAAEDRTIIISTHQVRDLEELIDNIVILDGNELLVNASVDEITRNLRFEKVEPNQEVLYSEKGVGGTIGVMVNSKPENPTGLDMELLFNAAIENKDFFRKRFNNTPKNR